MLSAIHTPWSSKGTFFKSAEASLPDLYFPLEIFPTTARGRAKTCTMEIQFCGYLYVKVLLQENSQRAATSET